ncbi:hypothetical protein QNH20_07510 [Neobacillus sp. WH10]|uniref:hypothetical protein n=1 Tax=Neobacillus sp. WH10 TaxID=3047873 RepID=UPI0024C160B9|nr:hypothetical protein [Neobacillus sp. WH10]WHY78970.1 hypothetical protein QNH20_07510 [Neobacillus sp. WH10]
MENQEQVEQDWKDKEDLEEPEESQEHFEQDRFTRFMFGPRREAHQHQPHHRQEPTHNQPSIDYGELMMNIDTLMESVRGLKPLFQKAYPIIEQFWKKK